MEEGLRFDYRDILSEDRRHVSGILMRHVHFWMITHSTHTLGAPSDATTAISSLQIMVTVHPHADTR